MISNEEKINLLKIEGKRLVQVYEATDIKEAMAAECAVCAEAARLMILIGKENKCRICYEIGVGKRCKKFVHLSDNFIGIASLLDPEYSQREEIDSRKKIKELILEVKDELDKISKEGTN